MQEMKLASHLMPALKSGAKKMTIRRGVRVTTVGEDLKFINPEDPNDTHTVWITGTYIAELINLPDEVAQQDGFADREDMFEGLRRFYPDIAPDSFVTVIMFDKLMFEHED